MSADTPDVLTEQEREALWREVIDALRDAWRDDYSAASVADGVVAAVWPWLASRVAAACERAAADAHVVHVTAEPVAEDVVWCESCEEWVTSGAPERAALGGEADPAPTWDCVNFTEPVTCLSAGVSVTARCGRCRLRLTLAEETVRLAALGGDAS